MATNSSKERRWRGRLGCTKFINHFDIDKTDHETWFEKKYLTSIGLKNRNISKGDFEGVLYNNSGDIALFELKLITFKNYQKEIDEALEKARTRGDGILDPSPKWEEVKNNLGNHIRKATDQLLKKMSGVSTPRIIFLILNTPDVAAAEIEFAITGGIIGLFADGKFTYTYRSKISDNKEAVDLFYNERISGLIALTLCDSHPYDSFIFRNKKATNPMPQIFNSNIELDKELP